MRLFLLRVCLLASRATGGYCPRPATPCSGGCDLAPRSWRLPGAGAPLLCVGALRPARGFRHPGLVPPPLGFCGHVASCVLMRRRCGSDLICGALPFPVPLPPIR
eukprot:5471720-Alexandrium_andersonii.AAC.1